MRPFSKTELSQLLSSYLDGELDETQKRSVEAILREDPEAHREFEQLKTVKSMVSAKKGLPPSIGFWTRLSAELDRRKREEENLLPFPKRFLPVVAVGAAVVVIVVGLVIVQQRATLVDYVSRQSERVQKAVEDNILNGSIMPLFSHVDKNQALQFAMFGTLPLDAKAETELRVNEDSARGYSIDLDKKGERKTPTVTVKEFVDEVRPNQEQFLIIDSLLDLARRKLEGSVFVAEDRAIAVDPQLSRFNRVILSGMAAALAPEQRGRFEKFLQDRRAPYMLAGGRRGPETRDRILHTMRVPDRAEPFLVVSPETVLVSYLNIDMDSLKRQMRDFGEVRAASSVHVNNLLRKMAEHEAAMRQRTHLPVPRVRIEGDSESFSIQIGNDWEGMPPRSVDVWIKPRMPIQVGTHSRSGRQMFNFQFGGDDSSFNLNIDLDSLMIQMQKEGERGALEFFKGDPRARSRFIDFQQRMMGHAMDSAFQVKKRKITKLDSLMREMEKRDRSLRQDRDDNQSPEPQKF